MREVASGNCREEETWFEIIRSTYDYLSKAKNAYVHLYADDTALYCMGSTLNPGFICIKALNSLLHQNFNLQKQRHNE